MKNTYYEFKNELDAKKWIYENYGSFIEKIQKDSIKDDTLGYSLFVYTGSMSKDYNNFLKLNNGNIDNIDKIIDSYYSSDKVKDIGPQVCKIFSNDAKKDISKIYNAFSLNKITKNILLFHYCNINDFNKDDLSKGTIRINKFISTTMFRKSEGINNLILQNKYNTLIIIKTDKEIPCIPIWNNPNSVLKEYEIILKPKMNLKICKKRRRIFSKIKYIFECEIK